MYRSPPPTPHPLRWLAWALVVGNLLLSAALISASALALKAGYDAEQARAREAVENMVRGLGAEIAAELKQIDNALATIASRFKRAPPASPEARAEFEGSIAEQRAMLPQVDALRATDAGGDVIFGLAQSAATTNVADRDYFKAASMNPGLVISEPIQGRIIRKWGIIIARRLEHADGSFGGVVYTNLSSEYLAAGFKRLALGEAGAVSLRSSTLRLIARHSVVESDPLHGLGTSTVSSQLAQGLAADPGQGWYLTQTALDGVERSSAYFKVPGYPLLVVAGLSTRDYLAVWRQEVLRQAVLMSVVILGIAGMSLVLFHRYRREHEARLEIARLAREQSVMLDNDMVGMVRVKNRTTVWKNRALDVIFGYEADELLGTPARLLYLDDASYEQVGRAGYAALSEGQRFKAQIQMRRKDGRAVWIDLTGATISDDESLWMLADITALKNSEAQAQHMALHDSLTGLPNRTELMSLLTHILTSAQRTGAMTAVCYVDLDGFKAVNDHLGHDAGDGVLREVSTRLMACVRTHDVVARLGGDEFVLVLSNLRDTSEVQPVLDRVLVAVSQPFSLPGGAQGLVSASIGVALSPQHGADATLLMHRADEAMYASKRAGKNRTSYYEPTGS